MHTYVSSYIIITLDSLSDLLLTRLGICYYKNIAEIRIKFWEKDIIYVFCIKLYIYIFCVKIKFGDFL